MSSRSQILFETNFIKNFAVFTEKIPVLEFPFNKVADLKGIPEKWDPEPIGDLYVGPETRDPICGNQDPIPTFMWNAGPITLGTLTLIQLSLNLQFGSVAWFSQAGSCTNLYNVTQE